MTSASVDQLEAYAALLDESSRRSDEASKTMHDIVHGTDQTDVVTENGTVPSHAKQARLYLESIPDAVAELSGQMANGRIWDVMADGRNSVSIGQHFWVSPAGSGLSRVALFKKTAADTQLYVFSYAGGVEVDVLNGLIQGLNTSQVSPQETLAVVRDEERNELLLLTKSMLRTAAFTLDAGAAVTGIYDDERGAAFHFGENSFSFGPLMFRMTNLPGLVVVDEEGNILDPLFKPGEAPSTLVPTTADPLSRGLYFSPLIVTAPGFPMHVDVSSMIAPREDGVGVVASVFSMSTAESETSTRKLVIDAGKFGPLARLKVRDPNNAIAHHIMDLTTLEIPRGPFLGAAPNILMIGDSISNRQGAQILKESLAALGYGSNFIGTLNGSTDPDNPIDASGPLGECREGYTTGNYTYADVSEITLPVPAGGESNYLSLAKIPRRNCNPFIRPATIEDDPAIVRNGYVLDFAYYQSRFGLQAPDIIVYGLGMNEFIQVTTGTALNAYVVDNERLMFERMRAAWPDAKILRFVPGLPFQRTRNSQWGDRYIPMIRGVMENIKALGNSKNILVPSWTFTNPETGYKTGDATADPITGVKIVEMTDNTHPIGANRMRLFQTIAPYIAAARLGLI